MIFRIYRHADGAWDLFVGFLQICRLYGAVSIRVSSVAKKSFAHIASFTRNLIMPPATDCVRQNRVDGNRDRPMASRWRHPTARLFRRLIPASRFQILIQNCSIVARADDDGGNSRAMQQPVERDLRNAPAGLPGDLINRVHHAVKIFIINGGPDIHGKLRLQAARGRQRLAAPDFSGQARPAQWTPHDRAHLLVETERHEFPFVTSSHERVIKLMRHAGNRISRHGEAISSDASRRQLSSQYNGFFPRAFGIIERAQGFFHRRQGVDNTCN